MISPNETADLWKRLASGDVNDPMFGHLLVTAQTIRDAGGLQTEQHFQQFVKEYSQINPSDGFGRQVSELIRRHIALKDDVQYRPMRSSGGEPIEPAPQKDSGPQYSDEQKRVAQNKLDGISALTNLGFTKTEAKKRIQDALNRGDKALDLESLVRSAINPPRPQVERETAYGAEFAKYQQGYAGDKETGATHLLQIAKAVQPEGMDYDQFEQIAESIKLIQQQTAIPADGSKPAMTHGEAMDRMWQLPKHFKEHFANPTVDTKNAIDGITKAQASQAESAATQTANYQGGLDSVQTAMDAAGVVDPTPVVDLTNAGLSLYRAATEPERAGEHLTNAVISGISAIPYIGDIAKASKYAGKAEKLAGAEAKAGGRAAHHVVEGGAKAGRKPSWMGSIFETGLGFIGGMGGGPGGGGGGGGGQPSSPGEDDGDGGTGRGLAATQEEAAKSTNKWSGAIQDLLGNMGGAVGFLANKGKEVYDRALKPILDWLKEVDQTSRKMLEEQRRLARYSGELDLAFKELDAGRFLRDVELARQMTGPTSRLADAQNRYEDAQQQLSMPWDKFFADLQALRTEVAAGVTYARKQADLIGYLLELWYGWVEDNGANDKAARNSMERAAELIDEATQERKLR